MKFDNDCVQNVVEDRYLWNKCFMMYPDNAAKKGAVGSNISWIVKLKIHLFQHLRVLIFQSLYNVTSNPTGK